MSVDLVPNSNWSAYFPSTDHCFQVSVDFEDEHVTYKWLKFFVIGI